MSELNGYATREALLAIPTVRRFADTEIDGLGKFRIRSLTAREKTKYDAAAIDSKGRMSNRALQTANGRLIVLCVVDHEGNQLLTDRDIETLQEMDASLIERLATECGKHCGLDDEDSVKN